MKTFKQHLSESRLHWKLQKDIGRTSHVTDDGKYAIHPTNHHPDYGYAHDEKNKTFYALHRQDKSLGVSPHYHVFVRSYRRVRDAKKAAQEHKDRNP